MTDHPQGTGPDLAIELDPVVDVLRAAGCVRAEDEAAALLVAAHSPAALQALVARRVAGEPLEHVLGWADFGGVRVRVTPGVFVPRHRSEHLVDVAAGLLAQRRQATSGDPATRSEPGRLPQSADRSLVVLDLCAGSGALGLTLHHHAGPFRLFASDLDPVAVTCAAANLAAVRGQAVLGDLFDAVPAQLRGRIDLILANAPYVPTDQVALMPHEAREHEPTLALDGGPDGLAVHRRILAQAPDWLAPAGSVLVEVADRQAASAAAIVREAGLDAIVSPAPDDPRTVVVAGQLPAGSCIGPDFASGK